MSGTLDVDDDFLTFDGLQAVTFYSRKPDDTFDSHSVASAIKRVVTKADIALGGGLLTDRDVVWHLPTNLLSVVPKVSDVVQEAGPIRWSVAKVESQTFGRRYRLACKREV